ncbi:non-homologous end-joining DNA ligase [Foetidibacter luteolus]|uniref:non-homologous end-joining DNA ligase n=1 Tax=Foetidibacter luteolus TaxID=2608880 RepID=UPI00129AB9DE|nr:non-homologous end-joining DNA ligase [Foetidibacter luteolus]
MSKAIKKTGKPAAKKEDKAVTIEGKKLQLTNLQKLYWEEEKITKGDVIDYYSKIYRYIIPYLKDRPQSMKRNPNGIKDEGFFQKDMRGEAPEWADTIELYSESANKHIDYFLCNNKASLIYMANLGCIEINPWNSRTKSLDNPDYIIMDIDPSEKNSFDDVIEVAKAVKTVLDKAGAAAFLKTSGASGMHVYVPLGAKYDYDHARAFAELVAHLTVELLPNLTTTERSLSKRPKNKLYVDYLQNRKGQTLASAYSLRPRPGATVSTPLEWKELKKGLHPSKFTIQTIFKRLDAKGDIFKPVLGKGVDMRKCLKNLGA